MTPTPGALVTRLCPTTLCGRGVSACCIWLSGPMGLGRAAACSPTCGRRRRAPASGAARPVCSARTLPRWWRCNAGCGRGVGRQVLPHRPLGCPTPKGCRRLTRACIRCSGRRPQPGLRLRAARAVMIVLTPSPGRVGPFHGLALLGGPSLPRCGRLGSPATCSSLAGASCMAPTRAGHGWRLGCPTGTTRSLRTVGVRLPGARGCPLRPWKRTRTCSWSAPWWRRLRSGCVFCGSASLGSVRPWMLERGWLATTGFGRRRSLGCGICGCVCASPSCGRRGRCARAAARTVCTTMLLLWFSVLPGRWSA